MLVKSTSFKGVFLALALLAAVGAAFVGTSVAAEVVWETDYAFLHFDWNGTWDKTAWWAYALWYLDIPDWGFLYGLYGTGWDQMWNSGALCGPGGWSSADKLHMYLYQADDGLDWHIDVFNSKYYLNLFYEQDIKLTGDWVTQTCTFGRLSAQMSTLVIYDRYLQHPLDSWSQRFLSDALATHVAGVLWPWGDLGVTLGDIQWAYQYTMGLVGSPYFTWDMAAWAYYNTEDETLYWAARATLAGAGYLFEDYDYLFLSAADAGGASSIYRVFSLLTYLRNDPSHSNFSGAFYAAYGHTAEMNATNMWYCDPDSNDFNAWMYYLMWGTWYNYTP